MQTISTLIQPYLTYIKLGLAALVIAASVGGGAWAGCSYKENRMAAQVSRANKERDVAVSNYTRVLADIQTSNEKVRAAQELAEQNKLANEEVKKQLLATQKARAKEEQAWKKKLDESKEIPECQAIREVKVCASLMDY